MPFWIKCGEFASAARSWRVRKLAGGIGLVEFHSFRRSEKPVDNYDGIARTRIFHAY
jgi:hypothetical protein